MKKIALLALLTLLPGLSVAGQQKSGADWEPFKELKQQKTPEQSTPQEGQPLTNDSILKLVNGGLGEDTIISMIKTQPGRYSLGTDAIIALKKGGVPEKVITAMLNKTASVETPVRGTPSSVPAKEGQSSQASPMPHVPADTGSSALAEGNARNPQNVGYDKFEDVTTVQSRTHRWALGKLGILGGGALEFRYQCPGQTTNCQPGGITVTFTRHGRGWILMYGLKEIIFLADGHRAAAREVSWDGLVTTDGVMEYFTGTLSLEDFHSVVMAQDVEMEVAGSSGFAKRFKEKDIEDWRGFGLSIGKAE